MSACLSARQQILIFSGPYFGRRARLTATNCTALSLHFWSKWSSRPIMSSNSISWISLVDDFRRSAFSPQSATLAEKVVTIKFFAVRRIINKVLNKVLTATKQKPQKNNRRWYYPPSHRLNVKLMLGNIIIRLEAMLCFEANNRIIIYLTAGAKTMFTSSAITLPKVNGFVWNPEHWVYIVGAGPGRFWTRSAQ